MCVYWWLFYKDEVDSDVLLSGTLFQETACGLKTKRSSVQFNVNLYSCCVTTSSTIYQVSMSDSSLIYTAQIRLISPRSLNGAKVFSRP